MTSRNIPSFAPRGDTEIGFVEGKKVKITPQFMRWLDSFRIRVQSQATEAGVVLDYAGSVAPDGYLICDGSQVSKSTYANLYAVVGDTFGTGTSTTFALPQQANRFRIGAGSIAALGQTAGSETITLTESQMPAHSHTVTDPGHEHAVTDPEHSHGVTDPGHTHTAAAPSGAADSATGAVTTSATSGNTGSATTGVSVDNAATGVTVDSAETGVTVDDTGGGDAVNITPPAMGFNWIIKT